MNEAVGIVAMALLHFLWQGAVVGVLAWLALALLRNARPQARYAVACMALLGCVLLPAWGVCSALFTGEAMGAWPRMSSAIATGETFEATRRLVAGGIAAPDHAILRWVVWLWAAGAMALSLRMATGVWWVHALRRSARMEPGEAWQACVDRLAPRFRIRRAVALRIVASGDSPVSAGWWRPVVLLPAAIVAGMPAHLLEALIAHELAHIRRHDYLVNLLQGAVEALLFYHPVTWWLSHRIRIERELVADDLAATALGERRRLAIALSELDRLAPARSPFLHAHFAQAAHGGHLMSRIRQLLRPERRNVGGLALLPLVGIAAAGIAFYAHARMQPASSDFVRPTPIAQAARPIAVADAASTSQPRPAPRTQATTAARRVASASNDRRTPYALVREGREGFSMSGDMDDIDEIKDARRRLGGDFIWFRRDGKAYVIRDADALARAQAAWQPTEALEVQMRALDERMRPHSERMEALGARMQALGDAHGEETPEMRAASVRMETLGEQMEALASQQVALAGQLASDDDARRTQSEQQMRAIESQQQALSRQMEQQGAVLEAASERFAAQAEPMERLGREMEVASKPMEGIGREMEVLGGRIEFQAKRADAEIRELIEDAVRRGLAVPAPGRQ